MARVKLTAGRIRDFCNHHVTQAFLWDTEAPGLAVRATAGGKAFIFQGKFNGKSVRMTIGDVLTWAIESDDPAIPGARQEARRLQTLIDQGVDPRQAKAEKVALAEAKRAESVRRDLPALDVWQAYIDARRHQWSDRHLADHKAVTKAGGEKRTRGRKRGSPEKTVPGCLRSLLDLPLSSLDADRVRAWLKDESTRRPTQARLAFALLRAFLNWCADHPDHRAQVQAGACAARIARANLPKKRAKADCLQREQLTVWFGAVCALHNPVISTYLQTLLLTGARRAELAGLRWTDVDLKWNSLTIRDKVEGERTIPLTPYVRSLLLALKNRNDTPPNVKKLRGKDEEWKPSPWVFASPSAKSGRLQEPRIAHNKALAAAALPALTLHGLRRSFGTLAEWVECPVGIVAQIQGHKPSATAEKHYRVRPLDLLRMWHTKIEAWILEQAGIELPGDFSGLTMARAK